MAMPDPEIERIMQRKMREMMRQPRPVLEVTDQSFDGALAADPLVLVDFWAEWCGPCKMMHPVFESLSRKYPSIRFARMDVDRNRVVPARHGVQAIPTFIMFRNGQPVERLMGAVGAPGIHMVCKKYAAAQ